MNTPHWYESRHEVSDGRQLLELDVPVLSLDERERRWAAIRQKMHLRGLAALVVVGTDSASGAGLANLRYVTQLGPSVGATAIFPLIGDPVVFYGAQHMHVPIGPWQQVSGRWIDDVRPDEGVAAVAAELTKRGLAGRRIGVVGYRHMRAPLSDVSAAFLGALSRGLPHAQISDETALIDELRLIKSDEELGFLRRAGAIARRRVERMIAVAQPGVTEAEVWAAMEYEGIVNGAEPCTFNLLSSGPVGDHDRVLGLLHGAEVPHTATRRVLSEGDLIISEFHTPYGGYFAHTEFSVFIGEPPEELARVHRVAAEIVRMAKDLFVPDRPLRSCYSAFHEFAEDAGMDWVELGFHGHGLSSPDFPGAVYRDQDLALTGREGIGDVRFQQGMVFGVNVDLHDPSWRRDVGVMLGDLVAVGRDGAEYLCNVPLDTFGVPAGAVV